MFRNVVKAVLFVSLFSSSVSWAVSFGSGKVKQLAVWSSGVVTVVMENGGGVPICTNSKVGTYAFQLNTDYGKAMYSTLLAARKAGVAIMVWGTGNCNVFAPFEDAGAVIDQY